LDNPVRRSCAAAPHDQGLPPGHRELSADVATPGKAVRVCHPRNPRQISAPTTPRTLLDEEDNYPKWVFIANEPLPPELTGEFTRAHETQRKAKGSPRSGPRRSGTSGSSKENVASQIRFFLSRSPIANPIHRAMSTPANNTPQNQTSIQGVGTTGTPLLAPARTQKDGVIGNSTVGTFGVCSLPVSLLQVLTIKGTGQVRVGPNAQGLGRRSPAECWILTDVIF